MGRRQNHVERWPDDVKVMTVLRIISVAWLLALGEPIANLFRANLPRLELALALIGVAFFVAIYLWVIFRSAPYGSDARSGAKLESPTRPWILARSQLRCWLPLGALATLGVIYSISYGNLWLDLLVYTGVAAGYHLRIRQAAWVIPAVAVLAAILGGVVNRSPGDAGPDFLLILSVGTGVATVLYALATVRELHAARGELARLAVAEERLRFARDLHDLLGHSLSLIALKSELAGQLAFQSPERAAAEMRDVEGVARTALHEVREAVSGYRQPTLASELAGAAEILAAAGIELRREGTLEALPARVEAALAWAVREGVTNVIRHSRAEACTIRLTRTGNVVTVEVIDNGTSATANLGDLPHRPGHSGLAGLAERIAALDGQVEAGARPNGGFGLNVTVPLRRTRAEAGPPTRSPPEDVVPETLPHHAPGEPS